MHPQKGWHSRQVFKTSLVDFAGQAIGGSLCICAWRVICLQSHELFRGYSPGAVGATRSASKRGPKWESGATDMATGDILADTSDTVVSSGAAENLCEP